MVSATVTSTRGAVDGDAPDHVEVDDAAVQLGVLDGAEGVEDLGFGDGHRCAPGFRGRCRSDHSGDYHYGHRYNTDVDRAAPPADDVTDRLRLGRHRHHLGVRRSHPARDLPVRPRARRRRHRLRRGRALRAPPQRRPPPPRQAVCRRLPRGHGGAARGRRAPAGRRSATGWWHPTSPSTCRCATTTCSSSCSGGRSAALGPDRAEQLAEDVGVDYGRAMAASMSPGSDQHRSFQAALHAVADAAHRPRLRRPRRAPRRRAAHRQRALPVRRGRDRASRDLRRRPWHGTRHVGGPVRPPTDDRDRAVVAYRR